MEYKVFIASSLCLEQMDRVEFPAHFRKFIFRGENINTAPDSVKAKDFLPQYLFSARF